MKNLLAITFILVALPVTAATPNITHDTFLNAVGPPTPPQGANRRLIVSRSGGTLLSRAMFRTGFPRPWHALDLTNLATNSPNAQINAYTVVGWNWDEDTATWQNRQGTTANPVPCVMTFYGDANLDGVVDLEDNDILAMNWQGFGDWEDGDFNGDGIINSADLNLLGLNFMKTTAIDPAEVLYIPKSGDNIALEAINTASVVIKSKEF